MSKTEFLRHVLPKDEVHVSNRWDTGILINKIDGTALSDRTTD
jgi:hypothetical protein